jgi:hypothetical protein
LYKGDLSTEAGATVTISKWSTVTFIIAFPNAVRSWTTQDWTLSLNKLPATIKTTDIANVGAYKNVWLFPITASK